MDEYQKLLLAQRRSLPHMQRRMSPTLPDDVGEIQRTLSQKPSSPRAQRSMDTYQEPTAPQKHTPSAPQERLADALLPFVDDTETYRLMVLRSNETEEELDHRLDQKASALGLRSSQDMNVTIDLITQDASALNLGAYSREDAPRPPRRHSRTSRSANTPSASSVESKESKMHRKTPSLAATSTATSSSSAPSVTSDNSLKSNYVRFKDSMKRMSTIGTKRKALSLQPSMTDLSRPPLPSIPASLPRSNTADQIMQISDPQAVLVRSSGPHINGAPWQGSRRQANSMGYGAPPSIPKESRYDRHGPPPPPSPSPAPPARTPPKRPARETYPDPPSPAAIARSQASPSLNALRGSQLQEQVRFITFRASQTRLMRKTHASAKDSARTRFRARQADLDRGHAAHLARLEESHLSAELDLERSLAGDRHACDARIRHMQAYISGPPASGMPRRLVTAADREKLELEVHGRGGMDNLHVGKIEVLRGQQEQQLERVGNKHEAGMAKLLMEYRGEKQVLRRHREEEEVAMERVFAERKRRMVARWGLVEAIERRTLELETGDGFAPLPVVGWGDFEGRDAAEEEDRYVKKVMGRGGFEVDEETGWMVAASDRFGENGGEDVTAGAGVGEYDAENMI